MEVRGSGKDDSVQRLKSPLEPCRRMCYCHEFETHTDHMSLFMWVTFCFEVVSVH